MNMQLERAFNKNHALSLFYQWMALIENKEGLAVKNNNPFFFSNANIINNLTYLDKGCFIKSSLCMGDFVNGVIKIIVIGSPDTVYKTDHLTTTALAKIEIQHAWYLTSIQMTFAQNDFFGDAVLEKITIKLLEINSTSPQQQHNAYNSSVALFYMWMACIESADKFIHPKSPLFEKFRQLHDKNYALNFIGVDVVQSDAMLNSFMCTLHEMMKYSHHQPLYFVIENSGATVDELAFEFSLKWSGISHDNRQMQAQTRHKWLLKKSVNSILDKISTISVSELEPFVFTDGGAIILAE
ncbi:hypothetical protein [Pseudomonas sp. TMP9]|uniref:hypothetical protein n=1 Tax=Pseudomonas sp. TMP9 TaxID=3133144 RepID=UPI0030D34822